MDISGSVNDGVDVQNSNLLHDNLFPLWEHLLTKANRRVGLYEILGHSEQNTEIPRDFRNCLGVNHTYEIRIDIFRRCLEETIKLKWPTVNTKREILCAIQENNLNASLVPFPEESIITYSGEGCASNAELRTSTPHQPIILIGAISKHQRTGAYEVHQMCKKIGVLPLPMQHKECFGTDNEDNIFLMDHTSRIALKLPHNLSPGEFVSGIVCAVKGTIAQRSFIVEDIIFPTPTEPIWPQVSKFHNIEMVFISGLHIGKFADDFVHRNLLMEYLQGLTGCPAEQEHIVKRKTRAFILGNTFCLNRKRHSVDSTSSVVETAKLVDDFISQISVALDAGFCCIGVPDASANLKWPMSIHGPKNRPIHLLNYNL